MYWHIYVTDNPVSSVKPEKSRSSFQKVSLQVNYYSSQTYKFSVPSWD